MKITQFPAIFLLTTVTVEAYISLNLHDCA